MTGVIRRGKDFRERLHDVLEGLWREFSLEEVRYA
jgi:hypothetical protein